MAAIVTVCAAECLGALVCISIMTAMIAIWAVADSNHDFLRYVIVVVSMPSAPCVTVASACVFYAGMPHSRCAGNTGST